MHMEGYLSMLFEDLFETFSNNVVLSLSLFLWGQVISRVGDMVGIKYFPAEPKKQQQEKGMIKVDWRVWGLARVTFVKRFRSDQTDGEVYCCSCLVVQNLEILPCLHLCPWRGVFSVSSCMCCWWNFDNLLYRHRFNSSHLIVYYFHWLTFGVLVESKGYFLRDRIFLQTGLKKIFFNSVWKKILSMTQRIL